ncbi:MAG: MogA/MoaB family molybdenum cofactor biosynthesis protein [Dehalococcoidia bacterium]
MLTSSDLGAAGKREDTSGDAIVELMTAAGHSLHERRILPDEQDRLTEVMVGWCDSGAVDIVLTTGGTGLGPRDVTPEATARVIDFQVPGIAEAMRSESLSKTPMAMISRAVAGVRGRTLVINLPGSPGGVRDNLAVVLPVLDHAVDILRDRHHGSHPIRPEQRA